MGEVKRFATNGYKIYDTFHDGIHWLVNEVEAKEIVTIMNNLDTKAREQSKHLSKLQKENEQLKSAIIGHIQYHEDLEKFAVEKGIIEHDWARFDGYD